MPSAATDTGRRPGTPAAAAAAAPTPAQIAAEATRRQWRRRACQAGFFALFLLAPVFDLLRYDLTGKQFYLLGGPWSLGIEPFLQGRASAADAALAILLRAFLPALAFIAAGLFIAWRWGRLYCGWLCPHFSAVELLNGALRRASGRFSLWDRHPVPASSPVERSQGRAVKPSRVWWPVFVAGALLFGAAWAVTLLTYLLPPREVWGNLLHGTLTANQARFIGIGTLVIAGEFVFARHLFCRFGCAVGLFQSLAWMANRRGMVVSFERPRARDCASCSPPEGSACEHACPMRLKPRQFKEAMFACVQCGRCLEACSHSQAAVEKTPLLEWKIDLAALAETRRLPREASADAPRAAAFARPADPSET